MVLEREDVLRGDAGELGGLGHGHRRGFGDLARRSPIGRGWRRGRCVGVGLVVAVVVALVETDLAKVQFAQRFLIPAIKREKQAEALREWFINRAKEKIVPRVQQHARDLGVDVAKVKIVDNRYRWGSCSPKNNVNINWRPIKAPMVVIDYVITHELAHLIESNHTPRFWNIVRSHVAHVDKATNWLKQHG